jgi:protein-disulfide isomerase
MSIIETLGRYKLLIISAVLIGGVVVLSIVSSGKSATSTPDINPPQFSMGDSKAPVKLVQYSDFLCPGCTEVSLGVMPKIITQYVDTKKVYLEFKPISIVAAGSQVAAEGAYCAADQNKFWQYHDAAYQTVWDEYFSKNPNIDPRTVPLYTIPNVEKIAAQAGVDTKKFDSCMEGGSKMQNVIDATANAQSNGINSAPYITVNGVAIGGSTVPNYDTVNAAIKANL